ncbi:hypothetical protein RJT34_30305 [Clitoria ternatea]|uniref:Uncharacterized protein n=1 Tax=Clitoria ternatea TaxID=43366 RepID=A0AAN9EWR3_CLITE
MNDNMVMKAKEIMDGNMRHDNVLDDEKIHNTTLHRRLIIIQLKSETRLFSRPCLRLNVSLPLPKTRLC